MKNIFYLDYKSLDQDLNEEESGILQVLKRYSCNIDDYENNWFTESIFNRLGWSNRYKDTVFSFHRIFCSAIAVFSEEYYIKSYNNARIIFYCRNNRLEYEINNSQGCYEKKILYKKATDAEFALENIMSLIKTDPEIAEKLNKAAHLTDSLSNFCPHPGYPFNQQKGFLPDTADSYNLMVDKIQKCLDENIPLICDKYETKPETLKKWHKWFIDNQSIYCLNDIYTIDENDRLTGVKLFHNQSLEKKYPANYEELKEYLSNIITILEHRGELMNNSIH